MFMRLKLKSICKNIFGALRLRKNLAFIVVFFKSRPYFKSRKLK